MDRLSPLPSGIFVATRDVCLTWPGSMIQGAALRCAAKRFASKSTNTRTLLER
jgi:hypothetical protein